jgi:hypothetical protein
MAIHQQLFAVILITGSLAIAGPVAAAESASAVDTSRHAETKEVMQDPHMAMRKLWEDHITYTRNYIISEIGDLGDVPAVSKRLLKNQDDIGDAIKPYYGDDAGKKLSALLRDHIMIATEVVKAAKVNDKPALDKAQQKWGANADDIADFLSSANPNWNKSDLRDMLHKHLDLTTGEAVSRLKKDWDADIDFYDRGHVHMLMFSDMLVDGIAKQFPEKFK